MEWTTQEEQIIKDNHGKLTLPQIKQLLITRPNIKYTTLRSKVQRMGFFRYIEKGKANIPVKNTYNLEYWKTPTLINSYLSGWIAADGCILKTPSDNYRFIIKLAIKDESIIDLFIKELNYSGKKEYCDGTSPHYPDRVTHLVLIQLSCFDKNAQYLREYFNIVPQKTKRLQPSNLICYEYNMAYICGILDGDGSIEYVDKNGTYSLYLGVSSCSKAILDWIKSIFDKDFDCYGHRLANVNLQAGNYYKYYIGGLRAAMIFDYLSQIPVPKLARKWLNPNILQYVADQKAKHPHLFKTFNMENDATNSVINGETEPIKDLIIEPKNDIIRENETATYVSQN